MDGIDALGVDIVYVPVPFMFVFLMFSMKIYNPFTSKVIPGMTAPD